MRTTVGERQCTAGYCGGGVGTVGAASDARVHKRIGNRVQVCVHVEAAVGEVVVRALRVDNGVSFARC